MLAILRRMFSRRSLAVASAPAVVDSGVRLNYSKLEPRIVLDASFTFAGGLLTLDGFTGAGEGLSISEGGGNTYVFTLATGTWTGVNGGGVSGNTLSQLTANRAQVDGLRIDDSLGIDFDIEFTTAVSFSLLSQDLNGDLINGDLQIIGVGDITQTVGSDVTVATLDASANSITLNDPDNDFDFLQVSAVDAVLSDTDGVVLLDNTLINDFELNAGGAITDANGAQISVGNNLTLVGDSISLADNAADQLDVGGLASLEAGSIAVNAPGTVNFLQLQVNSTGNVTVQEDSDTEFTGANLADNFTVVSAGSIRDATGTQFTISGDADFSAGDEIVLSDTATDALNVTGNATFLADDADISVGMDSTFSPYDCNLNQGDPDSGATVNFGSLSFDSSNAGDTSRGEVQIKEDSSTTLSTVAQARSIYLGTEGGFNETQWSVVDLANPAGGATNLFIDALNAVVLANTGDSPVAVDGLAIFRSRSSTVDVGVNTGTGADSGVAVNLGNLAFQSNGQVRITADSAVVLDCTSTAGTLILNVNGALTDTADATLAVTGNGTLTATGAVTLGDDATNQLSIAGDARLSGASLSVGSASPADFGRLNFNSAGAVSIAESSATELFGTNTAGSLLLTSTAAITDASNTSLTVGGAGTIAANGTLTLANAAGDTLTINGAATLSGSAIDVGSAGAANFASLNFNSAGNVAIREGGNTLLFGANTANNLQLTSAGFIRDNPATTLTIATDALLDAALDLTLANSAGDVLAVGGAATLSGASVSLGTVGLANFGSVQFNSAGAVNIQEGSDLQVFGTNTAGSLTLISTGAVTDDVGTTVTVTGNAAVTATTTLTLADNAADDWDLGGDTQLAGTAIAMGLVGTANFGTLRFSSAGDVAIREGSATILRGANTANNLSLASAGAISDQAGTSLTVTLDGVWTAAGSIVLADNATDLLTVGGQATFASLGQGISVGIAATFSPFDCALNQGDPDSGATVNFGTLSFDSANAGDTQRGEVQIKEDSTTTLVGLARARSLYLGTEGGFDEVLWSAIDLANPAGGVTNLFVDALNAVVLADTGGSALAVSGLAIFRSRTATVDVGVDIGTGLDSGVAVNLGSLAFQSPGQVRITTDSAVALDCTSTAGTLILNVAGSLTDTADATVAVTGNGTLNATGSIALGDAAGNVLTVGGNALLSGSAISIAGNGTANFGTLNFNAPGDVAISEDSDTVLTGANTGNQIVVNSAGSVTDAAGTTLVAGDDLTISAANAIVLGDQAGDVLAAGGDASFTGAAITLDMVGAINFGTLRFNSAGAVAITEDSDTVLAGASSANQVVLASAGSITDIAGATVIVANGLTFAAAGSISLADAASNALVAGGAASLSGTAIAIGAAGAVNFGTLNFNSPGAVQITEDSATVLTGGNTASDLSLTSAGGISDAAATTLAVVNNLALTAGGAIVLGDNAADTLSVGGLASFQGTSITIAAAGVVNFGRLTFTSSGDVAITEDSDMQLQGTNSAANANLVSAGAVSDEPNTSLTTTGNLAITAVGGIALADNAGDSVNVAGNASFSGASISLAAIGSVQFGTLTFNSPGAVFIAEDSATQLTGANSAGALVLTSAGGIADQPATSLTVAINAVLQATGPITLADSGGDVFSVGGNAAFAGTIVSLGIGGAANFGSVTIQASGNATLNEGSNTEFLGANSANTLDVNSAGTITDAAGTTMAVTTNLTMTAVGGIQLNDQAGDVLNVGGDASFSGTSIVIGSAGVANFGSLNFNSSGLVAIEEDSALLLRGSNSANALILLSTGSIEDANATSLAVTGNAFLRSSGVLRLVDTAGDVFTVGGQASFLTGGLGPVLIGMNPAFQPFAASFASTNPDSGGTANFGAIFFDTANAGDTVRQEVRIAEDSSSVLVGLSRASSLFLGTQGAVNDSHLAAIHVFDPAGGTSNLFFDARDSIRIGESAGIALNGLGIFRSATSTIEVGVNAGTFTDSGQVVQFGGLTVQAPGAVRAVLDSTVLLQFDNFGSSIGLAGANIFDASTATLATNGELLLNASGNILLGNEASTVTLGAGELRVSAGNASIDLDSSANLGSSVVTGVYHLSATSGANLQLIQTSGLISANAGAFEASGAVVLRNADLNVVAMEAAGAFSTAGLTLNANVPASALPGEVAAFLRSSGSLIVGDVLDPLTGALVSGIRTADGNAYVETLGAASDLTIQRPIAVGDASNTILVIAGGQLNLNSSLSRGNPLTDGLVLAVAPSVLVQNPFEFTQVNLVDRTQSVRFSYGELGELRFTVRVDWADGTFDFYAGNPPPAPPAGTIVVAGLQLAHPNGVSTIDVTKATLYDSAFLLLNPVLTSTLTIFNDAQILTYANSGLTDLNTANVNFDAFVNDVLPVVDPPPPPSLGIGYVPPEEEDFQEIINPDVRQPEFDDVQAAIGQQDELSKLYSLFLDDPDAPTLDWPEELDVESIKKQILDSPNSVFRPGTYEIIRQKEGQDPEVLETFEKDVDPEKNRGTDATGAGTDPALGQRRVLPLQNVAADDESIWTREWETWMAQGIFPALPEDAVPADGGQAPELPFEDQPDRPRFTVTVVSAAEAPGSATEAAPLDPDRVAPISNITPASSSSLLVGGAVALLQIHQRWNAAKGAIRETTTESSPLPPEVAASMVHSFDKSARRKRRLLG